MQLLERSAEPRENGTDFKQTVTALSGMNACGLTLGGLVDRVNKQVEPDMEIYSARSKKGLCELRALAYEFDGDSGSRPSWITLPRWNQVSVVRMP